MRFTRYVDALLRVPNIDASTKLAWPKGHDGYAQIWNGKDIPLHADLLRKLKASQPDATHM